MGVVARPVIVSSAHSGQFYPPSFLAASRLGATDLRRSEDFYVDRLIGAAPDLGITLIAATYPRAYCDVNRDAAELDPTMFDEALPSSAQVNSPRVAAGLGIIAKVVAQGQNIYRGKLKLADAQDRIARIWRPYHEKLYELIERCVAQHGFCLLLDVHSMPSGATGGPGPRPDIVLGDGFGSTAAPEMVAFIEQEFTHAGLRVRRNVPYAGGYITRHYGHPAKHIHTVQIEIARALYMDELSLQPHEGFETLRALMTQVLAGLPPSM